GDAFAGHRLHERIEIAAQDVDLVEPVLPQRIHVLRPVSPSEKTSVDAWVKSLDASVHHLREAGQVGHGPRIDCRIDNPCTRAAAAAFSACSTASIPPPKSGSSEGCTLTIRPLNASRNGLVWMRSSPASTTSSTPWTLANSRIAVSRPSARGKSIC